MPVFEFKVYGKPEQFAAIEEAIRTATLAKQSDSDCKVKYGECQ
jgi:hypothetical protein